MSSSDTTFLVQDNTQSKSWISKHWIKSGLSLLVILLFATTITFAFLWKNKSFVIQQNFAVAGGIIGFPPLLPKDGQYIQWTLLHLNDVYEILPLDNGKKGGLARVARVRELLLEENKNTYTVLSGDFLSPSALTQAKVNGTILNGKQMVGSLNTLGLDFVTFGNHEF